MAKSNIKHKKYFVDAWLEDPLFTGWLCKVKSNSTKARCLACEKDIELSTMGRSALKDHAKGNKKANAGKTVVVVLLIDLWVTLYFKLTATLPLYVVYRDSVFF